MTELAAVLALIRGPASARFVSPVSWRARDTGLSLAQSGILIRCGANKRFITEDELVVREGGTSTNKQIIEFRGEDAISSALISVVEGKVRQFYYVVGKGSRSDAAQSDAYNAAIELGRQAAEL